MLHRIVRILLIALVLVFILSQLIDVSLAAPKCDIHWDPTVLSLSATTNNIPWSFNGHLRLLGAHRLSIYPPRFEPTPIWSGGAFRWYLVLPWWLLFSIPGLPLVALWFLTRRRKTWQAFPVHLAAP